ncbi:MAG: xanthine dehydrogenase family protein molybdopterin-binding subunit, partial [Alphaproteobacteria bacterium]|nr:xanthine dehydrogenase family protein molybdopterin-binding subunit [Alphaproteobacteria bacterium]
MGQFGVGQPLARLEDQRLLTGAGCYTDDITLPGMLYGVVLRAPHAHAEIVGIDTSGALATPGCVAVLTGQDADVRAIGSLPCLVSLTNRDGSTMAMPPRPVLADGVVRHVGDAVAFVVAETLEAARLASESVDVEYRDRPAVAEASAALAADAPLVWADVPRNLCFDWQKGDPAKTDAALASAAHQVTVTLVNNRLISNAMEPRGAIGEWDGNRFTLTTSSQGSQTLRDSFGRMFGCGAEGIRVVTPDVGGGFGTKIFPYPEQALVLLAAKRFGRPVKWRGERIDSFLADAHGRDNVTTATAAVEPDGRITALKVETVANLGAYLSMYAPYIPTGGTSMLTGVYDIPVASVHVQGVFTHTVPIDAYRGAGRPEAAYVIERVLDAVADALSMAPADVRRRNFIRPEQMPYTTALGQTYDSGEFQRTLDDALMAADAAGFPVRRAAAAARGRLRGLGHASYIEVCGGGGPEWATVKVQPDGIVWIGAGSQTNGQGHHTAYAQILAEVLGIDPAIVTFHQGDTDILPKGSGTGGSRSIPVGGAAVRQGGQTILAKAKRLAAHYLEAAEVDIEVDGTSFAVTGTDRRLSLFEIAQRATDAPPAGEAPGLETSETYKPAASTYPNGTHVCEVEIDRDTGQVRIVGYWVVDDFGTVINPLMLAGQVHGGIAQGVGQALLEACVYDETGQI